MVYIATWVIMSHESQEESETEGYRELESKVYSKAEAAGHGASFTYADDFQQHIPTDDFNDTSTARKLIDKFEDDTFWNDLANRLAWRDAAVQVGSEDALKALDLEERSKMIKEYEDKYWAILEVRGIDAVNVA